jgi:uncharacterized protein (UPF0333 family)
LKAISNTIHKKFKPVFDIHPNAEIFAKVTNNGITNQVQYVSTNLQVAEINLILTGGQGIPPRQN